MATSLHNVGRTSTVIGSLGLVLSFCKVIPKKCSSILPLFLLSQGTFFGLVPPSAHTPGVFGITGWLTMTAYENQWTQSLSFKPVYTHTPAQESNPKLLTPEPDVLHLRQLDFFLRIPTKVCAQGFLPKLTGADTLRSAGGCCGKR